MQIRHTFLAIFTFFLLTLTVGQIFGQNTDKSIDVKKLVVALQTRYGAMKGLAANFTQIYSSSGQRLKEEGTLLLKRPGKMRWEYRRPEEKLFLADGKNVYFYVPSERQVSITPIKEADDPRTPFIFLLGKTDLDKYFKTIEVSHTETPVTAGNVVLEFVPKKVNNTLKSLYAEVDAQHLQLSRLVLINGVGERSDFLLSNFRENYAINDDQFTFVPPAGVKVLH